MGSHRLEGRTHLAHLEGLFSRENLAMLFGRELKVTSRSEPYLQWTVPAIVKSKAREFSIEICIFATALYV